MTHPTILFLCPHNAAKSVLAAAYGQQLADQYGLAWHITSAGTEPATVTSPAVVVVLYMEGIDVADHRPHLVTQDELAGAWRVITLGCDTMGLNIPQEKLERWDDIPPPSTQLAAARARIHERVRQLIDNMRKRAAGV